MSSREKKLTINGILGLILIVLGIAAMVIMLAIQADKLWLILALGGGGIALMGLGLLVLRLNDDSRLLHCPNCDNTLEYAKVTIELDGENIQLRKRSRSTRFLIKGKCNSCRRKFEIEYYAYGTNLDKVKEKVIKKFSKLYKTEAVYLENKD